MFPTRKIENNSREVFLSNVKQFFLTYLHIVSNTYVSTISYPNFINIIECKYYCVKNIIIFRYLPISICSAQCMRRVSTMLSSEVNSVKSISKIIYLLHINASITSSPSNILLSIVRASNLN